MGGEDHHITQHAPKDARLDFSHKHPIFDIQLENKGPQFSEIDERRKEYIRKFAGKTQVPLPSVPQHIPGLVRANGPVPNRRKLWWRQCATIERNGWMNIHTPNFNTRMMVPLFIGFLLYGWWGHATGGMYNLKYNDNGQLPGNLYDKLNGRTPPVSKIWLRPG